MRVKYYPGGGIFRGYVLIMLAFTVLAILHPQASGYAQSTNRNNPTLVRSREINGTADYPVPTDGSWGRVFYYALTAGPGEVTVTVISRPRGERAQYNISLEDPSGARIGRTLGLLGGRDERRMSQSYSFGRRTRVIMAVRLSGRFDYQIRLDGAVDIPRGGMDSPDTAGSDRGEDRREEGSRIRLPNRGILLIRMTDGSTREIDLSLVSEVRIVER